MNAVLLYLRAVNFMLVDVRLIIVNRIPPVDERPENGGRIGRGYGGGGGSGRDGGNDGRHRTEGDPRRHNATG